VAHLKFRISEKFRPAKEAWRQNLAHHETLEIPPPPPDMAKNALARMAAQIHTGHWHSAEYLKRAG
jgi:hypothetical protein